VYVRAFAPLITTTLVAECFTSTLPSAAAAAAAAAAASSHGGVGPIGGEVVQLLQKYLATVT